MTSTLLDTGPLVAVASRDDKFHAQCVELLETLPGTLLLPSSILIEASWLIGARIGAVAQAAFLAGVATDLAAGRFFLIELTVADIIRMSELIGAYRDLRLDPADASIIALAERLNVRQVATLDRRDFSVVRPCHVKTLTILP